MLFEWTGLLINFVKTLSKNKTMSSSFKAIGAVLFLALLSLTAAAQQITITGKVIEAATGAPLPGTFLVAKGTTIGTTAGNDGTFSIKVPAFSVIEASCIGFKTQEKQTGSSDAFINFGMIEDRSELDEVVVIGYGTLDKKELTSAIAHISSKEFLTTAGSDPAMMIQGKVAGVSIENTGMADPNNQASIQIRGISSRYAGIEPLIVIDGVAGGNLSNVNPNDIESIDILKDGAASAIYGTRGSNGVILINTKKGSKDGSFHATYDVITSANVMVKELDMLSAEEFRKYKVAVGSAEDFGGNIDWLKEVSRVGFSHLHTVTLSGGNSENNFRVSADYKESTGMYSCI